MPSTGADAPRGEGVTTRDADPLVPFPAPLPPVFDVDAHAATAMHRAATLAGPEAKDAWVREQLTYYESEYCEMRPIPVTCTTFNVGCNKPPANVGFILGEGVSDPRDPNAPDMVVVGLQEVDMSAGALIRIETEAALPWAKAIAAALDLDSPDAPYQLLAQRQLVGLMLVVCAKTTAVEHIRDMHVNTIATGALGTMANKGAIGFRCTYRLSSVCFVVCHLAAHQNAVAKRNQDIAQILGALNMAPPVESSSMASVLLPQNHDVCVVIGDLNYRINLPFETAASAAQSKDFATLLREDQLVRELAQVHTPWKGFTDLTPKFPPTYKYDVDTDRFDTSEKKRIPAYTDRILFCPRDDLHRGVVVESHISVMAVRSSDHKPVVARLQLPVKEVIPQQRSAVRSRLEDTLGRSEAVPVPRLSVSQSEVDFGRVSVFESASFKLVLRNTSECALEVFLARQSDSERDPTDAAWLRIQPSNATILPHRSVEVTVSAVVDWTSLRWALNAPMFTGIPSVPAMSTLMLAVHCGPAMGVSCTCSMVLGCFGNALDNIQRAGLTPCSAAYAAATQPPSNEVDRPTVVKEVWFLVDALVRGGAATRKDVFDAEYADPADVQKVMRHVNSKAEPLDLEEMQVPPEAVATTLMLLLRDLQLPVIPPTHHAAAMQAGKTNSHASTLAVLKGLPPVHHNVLVYLVSFGRYLTRPEHTARSGLTPEALASHLAPVLFALSPGSRPGIAAAMSEDARIRTRTEAVEDGASAGAATGAGDSAPGHEGASQLSLRREMEDQLDAATRFLLCLLAQRPELSQ